MTRHEEFQRDAAVVRLLYPPLAIQRVGRSRTHCKIVNTRLRLDLNVRVRKDGRKGWAVWLAGLPFDPAWHSPDIGPPKFFPSRLEAMETVIKSRSLQGVTTPYKVQPTQKRDPRSYKEAVARLGKRETINVANNTKLIRLENGDVAVRLHKTDIITYHKNGAISLDHGGWQTRVTRDRMVRFTPTHICVAGEYCGGWGGKRWWHTVANWKVGVRKLRPISLPHGGGYELKWVYAYFGRRVTVGPRGGIYPNQEDF